MTLVKTACGVLMLGAATTAATAGGIDRSGQSVGIIFETGNYIELSYGLVNPVISGNAVAVMGGFGSGDMARSYAQAGIAAKIRLNDSFDAAIIMDQPFGADVSYPVLAVPPAPQYYMAGAVADLNTTALTGILKYKTASNISVYGGLRYQTMNAKAGVPIVSQYSVTGGSDAGVGYLLGAAYEKPEIALRVALTYQSAITHELDTTETFFNPLAAGFVTVPSVTTIETPQSLNLEAQTGIAKDTLLFGSARWVDWSSFNISPLMYSSPALAGAPLVSYREDTINYTLGIGRRFNENWSGAISVGYESPTGGFSSNLGPTDGRKSLTIGATYTKDAMKITGGISYVDIGDTQTTVNGTTAAADFKGNSAVGVGIKVGFTF